MNFSLKTDFAKAMELQGFEWTSLLKSGEARSAFLILQKTGDLPLESIDGLSPDEKAYLLAELNVRRASYEISLEEIPEGASEWIQVVVRCMGYLFTAPLLALHDLDFLLSVCKEPALIYRFKAWKMHLLLLSGERLEGERLRQELEGLRRPNFPWKVECLTLFAISYFSTSQSKTSIQKHLECLKLIESEPEAYFETFGSAVAMRSALKANDAESFDHFAKKTIESLAARKDDRYEMRGLGYRAMVLTQLGETPLAKKYWEEGDKLLLTVDSGRPSVERTQYLTFRCLAAALLGELTAVESYYEAALAELSALGEFPLHRAELEICKILAPLANPIRRSQNLKETYHACLDAMKTCEKEAHSTEVESVRNCFMEANRFCESILNGTTLPEASGIRDKWKTLTVSIIDSYQNAASFAERIDYFRLIPKFVSELEQTSLTDEGISKALSKVLNISPSLTKNGFQINFEKEHLQKTSQIHTLLGFANSLHELSHKARENVEALAIANTTQMIVHDVKKPFNLLRMCLESLQALDDPKKIKELAEKSITVVGQQSKRVAAMLQDIIDISAPLKVNKAPLDLANIINNAISLSDFPPDSEMKLNTALAHSRSVLGDQEKLERVFLNIIENAIQAQPNGGEIWIETRELDDAAVEVTIGSASTIDPVDIDAIFDRFFTKGKVNGTGLGLAISKKIVEGHGGKIGCRSEQSKTEFYFTLPSCLHSPEVRTAGGAT